MGGTGNPLDQLSDTERAHVHVARAFIMNPEVMVLHRPFRHFHSEEDHDNMRKAMAQHVGNRGFYMPVNQVKLRRPRTAFFSSDSEDTLADLVWQLPKELGGECIQFVPTKKTSPLGAPRS